MVIRGSGHGSLHGGGERIATSIMGGLRVADQLGWSDVRPATRVAIALGGETLFVPARDEMIAILARFGRDKDRERALILARCTGAPG